MNAEVPGFAYAMQHPQNPSVTCVKCDPLCKMCTKLSVVINIEEDVNRNAFNTTLLAQSEYLTTLPLFPTTQR